MKTHRSEKHHKGLWFLSFTEFFERFGYYTMLGIFTLYLIDHYHLESQRYIADNIYGSFIALVYLTPLFGGILADQKLGHLLSVILGGIFMAVGYYVMGFSERVDYLNNPYLWIGLSLVIIGNGLFKPNISSLLKKIYEEKSDQLRKKAFFIFYQFINLGAFLANFVAAYLHLRHNHWAPVFTAAAMGMVIGVIIITAAAYVFVPELRQKNKEVVRKEYRVSFSEITLKLLLPMLIAGAIGWFLPYLLHGIGLLDKPKPLTKFHSDDAFLLASVFVILFFLRLYRRTPQSDKSRVRGLLIIFVAVGVFWSVFHQNGAFLTHTWAKEYTDREVKGVVGKAFTSLGLTYYATPETDSAYFNVPDPEWEIGKKPERVLVFPPEITQSINPFFIIVFTPLVLAFFNYLRRRGKEPHNAEKIFYGMVIATFSTLVLLAAVLATNNAQYKASIWWLIGSYAVITLAELFLSPVGLDLVAKSSPKSIIGLMYGGWFIATAIGNKFSGILSSLWQVYHDELHAPYLYFVTNFVLVLLATLLLWRFLPELKRNL